MAKRVYKEYGKGMYTISSETSTSMERIKIRLNRMDMRVMRKIDNKARRDRNRNEMIRRQLRD